MVFYAGWNYRFIPLLILSALVDYFMAIAIENSGVIRNKRFFLFISICTNLGILALFKYSDFVLRSASDILTFFGYNASMPVLGFVLPVGVSFYTFQSMSYTIDVYRGDMKAKKGLLEFTNALAFFPQLVAGPILRARQILPQMEILPSPSWTAAKHGIVLITIGLFKKTVADLLAAPVEAVFNGTGPVGMLETWTAVIAFAGQIYGDFSGYTDMAIGIASLLGFKIPPNFRLPYFATSPIDFWHRWHISLSTWLRDYLYISLGGNRVNKYRNLFITMLLGGLWHGAAWNFILWGFFHACILAAAHYLKEKKAFAFFDESKSRFLRMFKIMLTFYLVLIGWVFFRAVNTESAVDILIAMHLPGSLPESSGFAGIIALLSLSALAVMHLFDYIIIRWGKAVEEHFWLLWPAVFIFQFICFTVGAPSNAFIYFQF